MFKEKIKIKVDDNVTEITGNEFDDAVIMAYGITNIIRKWHTLSYNEIKIIKNAAYKPITGFYSYLALKISDIAKTNEFLHGMIGYAIRYKEDNISFKYISDSKDGMLISKFSSINTKELYSKKIRKALLSGAGDEKDKIITFPVDYVKALIVSPDKIAELTTLYEKFQILINEIENIISDLSSEYFFKIIGDRLYIKKITPDKQEEIFTLDIKGGMISTFSEAFTSEDKKNIYYPLEYVETSIDSIDDIKGFIYAFYQKDTKTRDSKLEKVFLDAYEKAKKNSSVTITIKSQIV